MQKHRKSLPRGVPPEFPPCHYFLMHTLGPQLFEALLRHRKVFRCAFQHLPTSELAKVALETGNAKRGEKLFYKSAACFVCHDPPAGAARLGPDLNQLKTALTHEELVDSILRPSKKVEREFVQWKVFDVDGKVHTGIKVAETDEEVVLRNADEPMPITISKDDIEEMQESKISSMPTGLVRQLKNRDEFNDLLRYIIEISKQ